MLNPNTDDLKLRTSKKIIEGKLLTFFEKMKRIAAFLHKNGAPADIQIKPEEIFLECYIDKPAIARLMTIAMQDNFAQFGVFFGLEDPSTHRTGMRGTGCQCERLSSGLNIVKIGERGGCGRPLYLVISWRFTLPSTAILKV